MKKLPRLTWRGGELEIDHALLQMRFPSARAVHPSGATGLKRARKVFAGSHGVVVGISYSYVINYFPALICFSLLYLKFLSHGARITNGGSAFEV
jgi:hypothetical protein